MNALAAIGRATAAGWKFITYWFSEALYQVEQFGHLVRWHYRYGAWLTWLFTDSIHADVDDQIPSHFILRWGTKEVDYQTVEQFWSEGEKVGVVPNVDSILRRFDITTWWGTKYTVWLVDVSVQVFVTDSPVTFGHRWVQMQEVDAWQIFMKHQYALREVLKGDSVKVATLLKQD